MVEPVEPMDRRVDGLLHGFQLRKEIGTSDRTWGIIPFFMSFNGMISDNVCGGSQREDQQHYFRLVNYD